MVFLIVFVIVGFDGVVLLVRALAVVVIALFNLSSGIFFED